MPTIELKETVGCTKKYRVEIERDRLDQEIKTAAKKLRHEIQIPGFRKGKAPEGLLLKRFGDTIRQEAIKDLIPKVLEEVFEPEGIKSVNDPEISDLKIDETGPIVFTVSVEEVPDIDASGFKGLRVTRQVREVTDEDVGNELERLRQMYATQEEVERGAGKGDILIVNLQKLDSSGVPIIGEKMENHVIALNGESTPSPEFDEQVFNMKKGDRKTVKFTYDESINNPQLVGQSEAYDVEVVKVMENKVPELNDEFVESLGNFENIDDLRTQTQERLVRQYEDVSTQNLQSGLVGEFIKQFPFEVPGSMVERIIQSEIDRMKASYPDNSFNEKEYRSQIRPDVVRMVQSYLIVNAVNEQQEIEITKEETDERIEALAAINNMKPREFRRKLIKDGDFDNFKNEIARKKAFAWMIDSADITVETIEEQQAESRIIKP
ncbi:MAG: trigger factor [Candidatus Latescibacteria bacterium]|jgi:trigger factor|nr:trigger factor [Candidatus Latescibacterota bacterium]